MTIGQALDLGQGKIGRRDAMLLLSKTIHKDNGYIMLHEKKILDENEEKLYRDSLARRQNGEPTQHILGTWDFMGHEFITDSRALIPRPETELLVQEVLAFIGDSNYRILDLCTGSGCIAISIALATNADVTAVDICQDAINLAKENAVKLNANIEIIQSDLFEKVEGGFDAIVSNPPYITSSEMDVLESSVRDFEPHLALDGGEDGMDFYRKIIPQSKKYLRPGGMLFLEIGSINVKCLMEAEGFSGVKLLKDYSGLPRIVYGVKINV